jgi:glutamine synthetase
VSHDPLAPDGVSAKAGAFIAGTLKRLPEYLAITAPAVTSYLRLTPHRWSAAFNNFGRQDREAAVRICPVFSGPDKTAEQTAERFNFEFRAADAAASPYLALAALINAGVSGLDEGLATPPVTERDLADATAEELSNIGCERLPTSLEEALARMTASDWAKSAFGETLIDVIDRHKRCEIAEMDELTEEERCQRYAVAY